MRSASARTPGQNQEERPAMAPAQNVGLVQQRQRANQKKKCRAAQAANHDVVVHFEPPCDSPSRRTISHTPRPISSSGQVNSSRRPWKISNWPSRNSNAQGNQHHGAHRLPAPPEKRSHDGPGIGGTAVQAVLGGARICGRTAAALIGACIRRLILPGIRLRGRLAPRSADRLGRLPGRRARAQIQPVAHLVQPKRIGQRLAVAQRLAVWKASNDW